MIMPCLAKSGIISIPEKYNQKARIVSSEIERILKLPSFLSNMIIQNEKVLVAPCNNLVVISSY
jgi:hypothetical protein